MYLMSREIVDNLRCHHYHGATIFQFFLKWFSFLFHFSIIIERWLSVPVTDCVWSFIIILMNVKSPRKLKVCRSCFLVLYFFLVMCFWWYPLAYLRKFEIWNMKFSYFYLIWTLGEFCLPLRAFQASKIPRMLSHIFSMLMFHLQFR